MYLYRRNAGGRDRVNGRQMQDIDGGCVRTLLRWAGRWGGGCGGSGIGRNLQPFDPHLPFVVAGAVIFAQSDAWGSCAAKHYNRKLPTQAKLRWIHLFSHNARKILIRHRPAPFFKVDLQAAIIQ